MASSSPSVAGELVEFLNSAWTPYHAVDECKKRLTSAGFVGISEKDTWQGRLEPGGKYFFTRNYSSLVAFYVGKKFQPGDPFWVIGAHTDSPCLKIRPASKVAKGGCLSVGVMTYGGGLWHTWFDRDLSVAGRVVVRGEGGRLEHRLVKISRPILRISTLAIHLDREVNEAFKINKQQHLLPVMATAIRAELEKPSPAATSAAEPKPDTSAPTPPSPTPRHHPLLLRLLAAELGCAEGDICDFELSLCDTQPSAIGGALHEFVFSGRLDNLCSSFCALKALIDATEEGAADSERFERGVHMVTLFDHEECGSDSAQGAGSPMLGETLSRITLSFPRLPEGGAGAADADVTARALRSSFVVSADMAHCLHPNYPEKHEESHQPLFHKGLVIKTNANQRYATDAVSASLFREIGARVGVPVQDFVVRNDMLCGSTIGPILASGFGVRTVDVGAPQWSMHSVREVCGVDDVGYAYQHFKGFFHMFGDLDSTLVVD